MANMYRSVLSGGGGVQPTGDAQVGDVLAGKTFSNADGIDKTGTMVNNGAVSATVASGQSYTIPAGYHNGSGTVTGTGGTISHTIYTMGDSNVAITVKEGDYISYMSPSASGWSYTKVDDVRNDSDDVVPSGYSLVQGVTGSAKLWKATSNVTHNYMKGASSADGYIVVMTT